MICSRNINDLDPVVARGATELKRRLKLEGYDMGTSATYRDNEYQNYEYSKGRTIPGDIVTNCKGGESMHNFRYAFDVFKNIKGQEYDERFLNRAGQIWQEMGGEWGGSWTGFKDTPHCQFTNGKTDSQVRGGYRIPAGCKMKWELVIAQEEKELTEAEVKKIVQDEVKKVVPKEVNNKVADEMQKLEAKQIGPSEVSEWAKEDVEWAKKNEISDGSRPKAYTTREETIKMIHNYNDEIVQ